jgi:fructoselysine 6-kinase
MRIIGVGDNTVDVYMNQNKMYPGGNSVNVPELCLRAGAEKAAYLGIFGDDFAGTLLKNALAEDGIDISHVRTIHGSNDKNANIQGEGNDRVWVGNNLGGDCAKVQLKFTQDDLDYITSFDVLHSSVHSEIPYLFPKVAGKVFVSMDFSDGYTDERIAMLCPYLDVAFFSGGGCSKEEIESTIEKALKAGAKLVVTTMGMEGSIATDGKERIYQPAIPAAEPVVDALGAGDTYIAAFLLEYWESRDMKKAAEKGAHYALTTLGYFGAFGHGVETDPNEITDVVRYA